MIDTSKLKAPAFHSPRRGASESEARAWRVLTLGERLGRRSAIVLWLAALVAVGLLAGWPWIAAAGLASGVLAFLPCAAMCALGLCAGDKGKKCSGSNSQTVPPGSGS
jgi:hypothetical protein